MGEDRWQEPRRAGLHNELSGQVHGAVVQANSIDQLTVHTAETTVPIPAQLPPRPRRFAGRDEVLAKLRAHREENEAGPLVVLLSGMAGVGKSALALRWLHEMRGDFDDGQLYVDLRGFSDEPAVRSADALEWFLLAFGLPRRLVPDEFGPRAELYRSVTADRSVMVLLDNALTAAQVRPLLPSSANSVVVVTSRRRLTDLAMDGARFVDVPPLDVADSVELLAAYVGADRVAAERGPAEELAGCFDGLPLALSLVAAGLSTRPHQSLADELDDLETAPALTALSLPGGRSMRAAADQSYRHLSEEQARAYRLWALHPGPTFAVEVAGALIERPVDVTRTLLGELVEENLLVPMQRRRVKYHDLLRQHARSLVVPDESGPAVRRAVECYLDIAVTADLVLRPTRRRLGERYRDRPVPQRRFDGHGDALDWLESERVNLVRSVEAADEHRWDQLVWQFCEALWGFYLHARPYQDWLRLHELGIAAAQRCGHPLAEARLRIQLAAALTALRRHDDATRENQAALRLAERENDEPTRADALLELASLAQSSGRFAVALDHFAEVRRIREVIGTPRAVALCRRRMGEVLTDLERYDEAIAELTAAAEAMATLDRVQQARALTALGAAYVRADRPAEAGTTLDRALELTGDLTSARRHRQQAYEVYQRSGDPRAADLAHRLR